MRLQENILFHNQYRLIKRLGKGGFSEVWLAEYEKAKINVALKVYAPGTGLDDDGVQLFSQEFSLVFNVNHTNLLRPTHFDIYECMPYLILPFCNNGSSKKLITKISEDEVWQFIHDVSSGLAYLHAQNSPLIHQDIKPENILIDSNGNFLITDFGVSTKARSTLRKSVMHSGSSGGGTRPYMGPERFGKEPLPIKASDIWALGATVYELITGDVPFGEEGGLIQKSGAEIPEITGGWSADLKKLITLCLNIEPWNRPTAEMISMWSKQQLEGERVTFSLSNKKKKNQNKKDSFKVKPLHVVFSLALIAVAIFISTFFSSKDSNNETVAIAHINSGDSYVTQGEDYYRKAIDEYQAAIDIIDQNHLKVSDNVHAKRSKLSVKIDSLVNDYTRKADIFIDLGTNNGNKQAAMFLNKALKLKDDFEVKDKLKKIEEKEY